MWCATRVEQGYQGTSGPVVCKQRTMEVCENFQLLCVYGTCKGSSQCTSNLLDLI